ncbi:uncharacterized protein LOC120006054 [Tripterygium wilfordii]|uniref:uncharacterized protein LOC120006054 n=1 Tax=Tripterygium wilfordii TaxID=458696 RepID=UPI0018F7FA01|nr:uncharacterized protein LOC120006054 [Tripterygium wilfordii]
MKRIKMESNCLCKSAISISHCLLSQHDLGHMAAAAQAFLQMVFGHFSSQIIVMLGKVLLSLYLIQLMQEKALLPHLQQHPQEKQAMQQSLFGSRPVMRTLVTDYGQAEFAEKLVELMPSEALAMHDCGCYTPLHYAAMSGNLRIAKALVRKNAALPQITDAVGYNPLLTATFVATEHKELVWFLAKVTTDAPPSCPFTGRWSGRLICYLTHAGFHDISLFLLQRFPDLATAKEQDGFTLLQVLALEPSNFPSGSRLSFWERWIYQIIPIEFIAKLQDPVKRDIEHPLQDSRNYAEMPTSMQSGTYMTRVLRRLKMLFWEVIANFAPGIKRIQNAKLRHKYALELVHFVCKQVSKMGNLERVQYFSSHGILAVATICGVVEIVTVCLQYFPEILWLPIDNKTILQHAIAHRQEKIFNLLFERNAINKQQAYSSESKENILILAAKLPPHPQLSSVSGPALQMQREMQWFKTVESFIHPAFKELRLEGKTAWHTFQDQHQKLLKEGQRWMKDTSNSCMVVSTLIATVVFAAAFTVPGGNIQDKGIPIFLKRNSFKVFAVSDALALFSSATSILMFLSILTSRYAEEDFLEALPKRLIIGLASLFIAIAAMMVAFGATLSLVLGERWEWVHIPTILLATFPVALFAMLQLPLFFRMVKSTYGPSIFRPQNIWQKDLCYQAAAAGLPAVAAAAAGNSYFTCNSMATTSTESKDHVKPAPLDLDPLVHAESDNVPDEQQKILNHTSEAHAEGAEKGSATTFTATAVTANATEPVWQPPCYVDPANRLSMGMNSNYYRPLFLASLKGDWDSARRFFERDPDAVTAKISVLSMTALHVAVSNEQAEFVEKLVELMPSEALDCQGIGEKNPALPQITDMKGHTPLQTATVLATEHKELIWFLAKVTTDAPPSRSFTGQWAGQLICFLTHAGFHDISLYLLWHYPHLTTAKDSDNYTLLQVLALGPSNFLSGSRFSFWERWIYQIVPVEFVSTSQHHVKGDVENLPQESGHYAEMPSSMQPSTYMTQVLQWFTMPFWVAIEKLAPGIKRIRNKKLRHKYALQLVNFVCKHVSNMGNQELFQYFSGHAILVGATICGVVEIVTVCLQYFPELLWIPIDNKTLMQYAIEHRQEKIFNLMYERNAINKQLAYTSESKTNILIMAAKLPPYPQLSSVSGPALQMQREMQWFKAVESFIHPALKELRFDGKTAWHIFQDEHKKMLEDGQKWMKETSNSCMLVATLIATVVFAAAFTVPGGNINDKGIPVFLNQNSFKVFAVWDALALFSSVTAILMFLSILTSRCAEEDFLTALLENDGQLYFDHY